MNKKNILIYSAVFFIIFFIEFGLNSYLSFSLEKEQYLFYQNIINLLPLFTTFVGFGTPFAVLYLTSLSKVEKKVFILESNLFTLYFSLFLLLLFSILYSVQYIELYILVALILGFFNAVKQNGVNFFLAKQELNKSSFIRLNQKLIYLIIILLVISFTLVKSDKHFSFALVLGELVGFIVLVVRYKLLIIREFKKIKTILKISRYAFLANLFSMISLATPILLLNYFNVAINEIIVFSIAYVLLKYSGILLAPMMQLITPYFTPIKNDLSKIEKMYKKYFLRILGIGVLVSISMYILSGYIIELFFNNIYSDATALFKILVFAVPFLFLNSFTMSMISSVLSIKLTSFINLFTMIMMILGNIVIHLYEYNIVNIVYFILIYYILLSMISSSVFVSKVFNK